MTIQYYTITKPFPKQSSVVSENIKPEETPRMESQAIKQRQISSYITKLNIIHDKVKVYKYPSVEPSAYKELSIKCKELKVASDGTYDSLPPQPYLFDPNVRVYPREFRDEESRRHYVFQ